MAAKLDRDTSKFLASNAARGNVIGNSMSSSLNRMSFFVDVQLPKQCADSGDTLQEQAVPIRVNFAKAAKSIFPEGKAPEIAFVETISVQSASLENGTDRRLSLSAFNGVCGRAISSDADGRAEIGEPLVNGGTFLVMTGGSTINSPQENVYDATGFAAPGDLFSKYPGALKSPIEDNLSYMRDSPSVMYTSIYNDSEPIASECTDGPQAPKQPQFDWFLGLISKNLDLMETPPVVTKKPGSLNKYIYTLDIARNDLESLQQSAHDNIYAPLKQHVISLRDDESEADTAFHIIARSEAIETHDQGIQSWPASTKFNAKLRVTIAFFNPEDDE